MKLLCFSFHFQDCSYIPGCDGSTSTNDRRVEKYQRIWGNISGHHFDCMYKPDETQVIRYISQTEAEVIHMLVWPSILILAGCVIMLILFELYGCDYVGLYCKNGCRSNRVA